MPFVYDVQAGVQYTSHATPGTEDPTIVLRQATGGFNVQGASCTGKAAAATSITGIAFRVRRWTTAGSGGTSVTPSPRNGRAPAATTTAVDKQSAITAGTVSGAYQLGFGCGKAGPGGWMARDADSMIHVEAGGADELDFNSIAGEASLNFELALEINEA